MSGRTFLPVFLFTTLLLSAAFPVVAQNATQVLEDDRGDVGGQAGTPPEEAAPLVDLISLTVLEDGDAITFTLEVDAIDDIPLRDSALYRIEFMLGNATYRIELERTTAADADVFHVAELYRAPANREYGDPVELMVEADDGAAEYSIHVALDNFTEMRSGYGSHTFSGILAYSWHAQENPPDEPGQGQLFADLMMEGVGAFTVELGAAPAVDVPVAVNNTTDSSPTEDSASRDQKSSSLTGAVAIAAILACAGRRRTRR